MNFNNFLNLGYAAAGLSGVAGGILGARGVVGAGTAAAGEGIAKKTNCGICMDDL
jgi:hypothetical protein